MATTNPVEQDSIEDNFELELNRVRENVRFTFLQLIDCLKVRENELLSELDKLLQSYHSFRDESKQFTKLRNDLERMKLFHEEELQSSSVKNLIEKTLKDINKQLRSIKEPTQPKLIKFVHDRKEFLSEVRKLGGFVESATIDYSSKVHPLVSIRESGKGTQQLYFPQGVAVHDRTRKIYVADCANNCVKVFDYAGKYLFAFGHKKGAGKMEYPFGLAIYGNKILITEGYNSLIDVTGSRMCILSYQLDGKFICSLGRQGTGDLEFNIPLGLTIDQANGTIYVCDCNNMRIQIISKDFNYISEFGRDTLSGPRDIKLSAVNIFVLDVCNPSVLVFDRNYVLQSSVIAKPGPFFISVDYSNNLLISNRLSQSILIFNTLFELIARISVSEWPMGITVDQQGRLIVVYSGDCNRLDIF